MKNAVFGGLIVLVGVCVGTLLPAQSVDTKGQTLREIVRFDLPGPPGKRFDYLTIDGMDHWLLSAHLSAGQTYLIDLRTNKVVGTIADTPGVEGIEFVPETQMVYTSNRRDNTIGIASLASMKVVKLAPDGRQARWECLRRAFPQTLRLRRARQG